MRAVRGVHSRRCSDRGGPSAPPGFLACLARTLLPHPPSCPTDPGERIPPPRCPGVRAIPHMAEPPDRRLPPLLRHLTLHTSLAGIDNDDCAGGSHSVPMAIPARHKTAYADRKVRGPRLFPHEDRSAPQGKFPHGRDHVRESVIEKAVCHVVRQAQLTKWFTCIVRACGE